MKNPKSKILRPRQGEAGGGQNPKSIVVTAMSPVVRQSARKVRLVVDAVKSMNPSQAISMLRFMKKRAADPVRQTIERAIANATKNLNLAEQLFKTMHIDVLESQTMKRFRIGGRGRIKPVLKRTSRIMVKLFVEGGSKK